MITTVQGTAERPVLDEYGVPIAEVASAVRENVSAAVERMADREVVEVNIMVSDVKLPDKEGEERQRVQ
ncbi:Asp23/Gls24 family envelope stress response protein [Streptomyces sp. CL12-4]|nr:Asp23/Gls24 family envelope stress response protein [Streptomyces sp. CL12-4]